jgi:hypothetical protein
MKRCLLSLVLAMPLLAWSQKPLMHWDFENVKPAAPGPQAPAAPGAAAIPPADIYEGHFEEAPGVVGKGIRMDGFTTRIIRDGAALVKPGNEFTVEGWVSLGEYPWNWCPVFTTESNEVKGYRLMIGPWGQASFEAAIGEQWVPCTSGPESVPLRKWIHIAGVYTAKKEMALYINGELAASIGITAAMTYPVKAQGIIGMTAAPGKPSDIIRTWATVEAFHGLDGILDEIKVLDQALTASQIKSEYAKVSVPAADIAPRPLPRIEKNPGRFGAFYTKLQYYPGWDNIWPVDQDPDIVVCFEKSPVKLVFWRGIRYGPCWVSENEIWMADQSLETWGVGKNDIEGCFEHMQDRHCRFSHVRIIESTDARAVVHWRYAPVSSHDNTWMPDPKTGWECWVDEYYYIYPDGSAIRKVSWNKGTVGRAVQYQESLPLLQPGQGIEEILEKDYVSVADYAFNSRSVSGDLRKQPADWPRNFTVQRINFKAENKPFICFEPGNRLSVRWIDLGYNHFPVAQARCDGRWTKMLDRPSSITSSPISDPVIHDSGNRQYWTGLYGMNAQSLTEIVRFGRSWAFAAEMTLRGAGFESRGYDKSQRCYQIENRGPKAGKVEIVLQGNQDSPVINPAIHVTNWNASGARILVNGKDIKDGRVGITPKLQGTDLAVFLFTQDTRPVAITILPR